MGALDGPDRYGAHDSHEEDRPYRSIPADSNPASAARARTGALERAPNEAPEPERRLQQIDGHAERHLWGSGGLGNERRKARQVAHR